jgi:two-component system cell cycle response regulator
VSQAEPFEEMEQKTLPLEGVVVCLVEDDPSAAKVYSRWLKDGGAKAMIFSSVTEFANAISNPDTLCLQTGEIPKIALTDLVLPDGTGLDVVTLWKKQFPSLPILVCTAFATVENAVQSMKLGAFDFLRKPVPQEELILVLRRAADYVMLLEENETLASSVRVLGMAQTLSQITDNTSLLKTLGRLMHRETKADECFVFFFEAQKGRAECLLECRAPGLPRIAPEIIATDFVYRIKNSNRGASAGTEGDAGDLEQRTHTFQEFEEKNTWVIELISQTKNSAFVVLRREKLPQLSHKTLELLSPIIVQAARAFQSADITTTLSFVDGLTGLYNQKFLSVTLNNEIARTNRYGNPVSVLFIDLDKFKSINDTHGHIVGSELLKEAAKVFQENVRESDYLLRFGGDEFVAILPSTTLQGAIAVAERIRNAFDTNRFDVRATTNILAAHNLQVTTSIGVATYPDCATSYDDLVQRADDAMYSAKHAGKNQVFIVPLLGGGPSK